MGFSLFFQTGGFDGSGQEWLAVGLLLLPLVFKSSRRMAYARETTGIELVWAGSLSTRHLYGRRRRRCRFFSALSRLWWLSCPERFNGRRVRAHFNRSSIFFSDRSIARSTLLWFPWQMKSVVDEKDETSTAGPRGRAGAAAPPRI